MALQHLVCFLQGYAELQFWSNRLIPLCTVSSSNGLQGAVAQYAANQTSIPCACVINNSMFLFSLTFLSGKTLRSHPKPSIYWNRFSAFTDRQHQRCLRSTLIRLCRPIMICLVWRVMIPSTHHGILLVVSSGTRHQNVFLSFFIFIFF